MIRHVAAVSAWLTTAALGIAMAWTLAVGGYPGGPADGNAAVDQTILSTAYLAIGLIVAITIAYATVGLFLASRTGGGRVGAVLLAGGLSFACIPFGYLVGGFLIQMDPADPIANAVFLLGPASIPIGYSMILPVLALVFPHGRLPSRRWRWPAGLVAALLLGSTGIRILAPGEIAGSSSSNPFGVEAMPAAVAGLAEPLAGLGILAVSVLGVGAVLVRYRRGSIVERQQLRWFVAAVMLAVIPIAVSPQAGIGGPLWILLASIGLLLVPVSVGIAITRYRLYEIDRIVSRTIGWGVVTVLLAAVFVVLVAVLQTVLAPVTDESTLAVAASTLVAVALFQPLRRRVQQAVDRRFDRSRYDSARVAGGFSDRLRDQVDIDALRSVLLGTVNEAVRPTEAGLWLQADHGAEP